MKELIDFIAIGCIMYTIFSVCVAIFSNQNK